MLRAVANMVGGGFAGSFTTLTVSGQASFADGTAAAPSIAFSSDPDTGIFRVQANALGVAAGGVQVMRIAGTAGDVNSLFLFSAATGNPATLTTTGEANAPLSVASRGTGYVDLCSNGGGTVQVRVNNTTGATRALTLTGSNGGSPTIGTTAGDLAISTGVAVSSYLVAEGVIKANRLTALPAGGSAGSGFTFYTATNFGVTGGSGAPTLAAAKGSLYLRSDGSTVNDRAYINTDGGTTWTALVTVA